jgi:membrane-bound ClpP family serine protease
MSQTGVGHTVPEKLIETQLDAYLEDLEKSWHGDAITYIGPITDGADDIIRDEVEAIESKKDRLFFILETSGGYIEIAQRIADSLRHHYPCVDFVIPNSCMSAGTVLVMSGNAIHMDYYSVLGPIDPQVQRASDGALIPAIGYLAKYQELIEKAKSPEGLTMAEITYLVQRFDPAELYSYEQARELSVSLLKEWLVDYKFRDWTVTATRKIPVTEQMKKDRAEEIAKELGNNARWHSHGRGISMAVLVRDLNLQVEDLEQAPEIHGKLRAYYKLLKGYAVRMGHQYILHRKDSFLPSRG